MFCSASRALFSNLPVCVITAHEQKQLGSQRIVAAQSSYLGPKAIYLIAFLWVTELNYSFNLTAALYFLSVPRDSTEQHFVLPKT